MSSYRKHRSRKSIYHPGISLSHPITYNQKKGMVIQRDTNLPQSGHVYTRKELERMYRILLSFHMISSKLNTVITNIAVDLTPSQLNEILLNYDNIKVGAASAVETPVGNIAQLYLQAIVVAISNGAFPKVSYRWVIGASSFSVSSGTNSLGGYTQSRIKLGTPIVYKNTYSPDYVYINLPQVKNSTSNTGVVSVQWDQIYNQTADSTSHDVHDLYEEGVRNFPWVYYDVRLTDPIDSYTELSVDMTGNTNAGSVSLECVVVYEE